MDASVSDPPPPTQPDRFWRWLCAFAWLAGAAALLVGLAWWGVPRVIAWQLETRVSERLGRAVRAERIEFVPWALRTTLHGLTIAPAGGGHGGGSDAQFAVRTIRVRTALASVWTGAPVIDALEIDAPRLSFAIDRDGRHDLQDVLDRLARPAEPERPPVRFALRHFRLSEGEVDIDDRGRRHALRDLTIDLPSLSSLAPDRSAPVTPRLAFTFDGSRVDTDLEALPFAEQRRGEARLRVAALDLAPLRDYLPAGAPLRLDRGTLDADLRIRFADVAPSADGQVAGDGERTLEIGGTLTIRQLVLSGDDAGTPTAEAERIDIALAHLRPFDRSVELSRIAVGEPHVRLQRRSDGRLALAAGRAGAADNKAGDRGASNASTPWQVRVADLQVENGSLDWRDAAVAAPVALGLRRLEMAVADAAWPVSAPALIKGSADVVGPAADLSRSAPAREGGPHIAWDGTVAPAAGRIAMQARALPLAWAAPYLQARLKPALAGRASADGTVAWSSAGTTIDARSLAIDALALTQGADTLLGVRRAEATGLRIDTARRTVAADRLALAAPQGTVARDAAGRWMVEQWRVDASPGAATAASASAPAPS
ncbi:DUF748 domain-containing protein, partial [uncultured Xylophilus sp.]|uniref:DUF748 domain-containing protein n=1 Tax=uncultured Xylophilus sp. TaxID=296832 RepID=UPI0025F0210A